MTELHEADNFCKESVLENRRSHDSMESQDKVYDFPKIRPIMKKYSKSIIMYFSRDAVGSVVNNTLPVPEIRYEMKSSLTGGKAADISLFKSFVGVRSMSNISTQCTTLPVEMPASQDAHYAKQVYDKLPFEAKIHYLLKDQYTPQAAVPLSALFNLKEHLRTQLTDGAMSKIEGICALYIALSSVSDATGFLAVLTLYAKTHSQTALVTQLGTIVEKLFSGYTPQSFGDKPAWLSQMKDALHNWKLLTNNPAFAQISRVVSLLVTLGIIENATVTLGNFEIFAVEAQKKHCNAVDLMDAIVDTITFFAEAGYMCFVTGSLSPLLFSSPKLVQMEEKYIAKLAEWEHARNGNLLRFLKMSEAQFDRELKDLIEEFHQLYTTTPNGTEKKITQQKWEALNKIYTEFTAIRISGGLRKAPLAVKIYGNSGVGKSTFADITMATVLKAMGVPSSADYICTINEADQYMPNYRSYITGVKIDDLGNTKKEFWEVAPSESIIKIVNNIREYAIMADLPNKGKISIEPSCLTITTNVEELHAGLSSYNAMSVLRRCHLHVELKVRPEFLTNNMLDSSKVIKKFGNLDQLNDIWLITLKQPIGDGRNGQEFGSWRVTHENLSITEYVNYLVQVAKQHNHEQSVLVDSFTEPSEIVNICPECDRCVETCTCIPEVEREEEYVPHFGERLAGHITRKARKFNHSLRIHQSRVETCVEDIAIRTLLKGLKMFEESPYAVWTSWIPQQWMDNDLVKSTILSFGEDVIGQDVRTYSKRMISLLMVCGLFLLRIFGSRAALIFMLLGLAYYMITIAGVIETKKEAYMARLVASRDTLPECFKTLRDQHVKYACGMFAALGILYAAAQTYKALKANLSFQGKLAPKSISEIRERDAEADVWKQPERTKMIHKGSFVDQDKASRSLRTAMGLVTIGDSFSGAFCLRSKIYIIPSHMLPDSPTKAVFQSASGSISMIIEKESCYVIPNTDAALVYVPNAQPAKDMLKHFENDYVRHPVHATIHGVDQDLKHFRDDTLWHFTPDVHNGYAVFPGAFYTLLNMMTFEGMCMSPIVSDSLEKKILGFHIGGVTDTRKGCGFAVTAPQLVAAMSRLDALSKTHMPAPQASDLPDTMLGKEYAISGDIHPKCPTNYITGDPAVIAYGTVAGKAKYVSRVISTPITDIVTEVTGVPNTYGPPKFTNPVLKEDGKWDSQKWRPWYESLEVCSKPSVGFPPSKVDAAMNDYLTELKEVFNRDRALHVAEMKPLSHQETISGIEGRRFIDAMVTKTSMGYPLGGPKRDYLVDLPPTEEHACPRDFTPEIQAEIARVLEKADSEEMLNLIFGASLKDEPTNVKKDKVRVFQAAPLALQYVSRKYFLPIARFLSLYPLVSETAVGINSHGPEWDELSNYMAHFGDERIIAGDYSKYDLRMPAQLTISAFSMMIEIAQWSGNYTEEDIRRMRVIAHDICTPLVAYNGTLIRFLGTNPSGQNMTVYVNSIVNSLLHRICFFDAYSPDDLLAIGKELGLGRAARFRDLVKLATYGDDAKGSVRRGYDKFNHVSMARTLAANDMVFTMPDKESQPIPFMSRYEADFLKRKDRYEPELGAMVGALDESSIFKSLHSILESKEVTPREVCTQNVDGALREWFYHGREVFEKRREQMKEIARRANLPCRTLDDDFDDRVAQWKEKYVPQMGKVFDPRTWYDEKIAGKSLSQLRQMEKCITNQTNGMFQQQCKLAIVRRAIGDYEEDEFTPPSTIDMSDQTISEVTEPVSDEQILCERVTEVLGKPSLAGYDVIRPDFGEGDMLYLYPGVALVIECKRVVGRKARFRQEVKEQAIKYANVIAMLRGDLTVYGITYTELGFTLVECIGEPRFPEAIAAFLDTIHIDAY